MQLQKANPQLQRCEEGYFDGFSPQPLLQLQDFTGRVARSTSNGGQAGAATDSGIRGERLRGAMRVGTLSQRGKAGSLAGCSTSGGTAVVQCRRDEDGNAGYRVTLNQLEVCEISRDSVGYANGLRNNQRVTHVDGHSVRPMTRMHTHTPTHTHTHTIAANCRSYCRYIGLTAVVCVLHFGSCFARCTGIELGRVPRSCAWARHILVDRRLAFRASALLRRSSLSLSLSLSRARAVSPPASRRL